MTLHYHMPPEGAFQYVDFPPRAPAQHLYYDGSNGSSMKDLKAAEMQVRAKISEVRVTSATKETAEKCVTEIKKGLDSLNQAWRVRVFGSFANGLCTKKSDLDVTCFKDGLEGDTDKMQAKKDLREQLFPYLEQHPDFEFLEDIWTARVPVMKLRFAGSLEVDLSCQNVEPFPNTQLLRAYVELGQMVKPAVVAVKLWAKAAGVCGAKDRYLSSYSFALMAIYYLQVDPNINLPCLPTWNFTAGNGIPKEWKGTWSTNLTVADILHGFFNFYAYEFQWGEEVVSIRHGRRTTRSDPVHSQLKGTWEARLHVADPFLLDRNLNCVLGELNETAVYNAICEAAATFSTGRVPIGFDLDFRMVSIHEDQPPAKSNFVEHFAPQSEQPGADLRMANRSDVTNNSSYYLNKKFQSSSESETTSARGTNYDSDFSVASSAGGGSPLGGTTSPGNAKVISDSSNPRNQAFPQQLQQKYNIGQIIPGTTWKSVESGQAAYTYKTKTEVRSLSGFKATVPEAAQHDKGKNETAKRANVVSTPSEAIRTSEQAMKRSTVGIGFGSNSKESQPGDKGKSTVSKNPSLDQSPFDRSEFSAPQGVCAPSPENVPMTLLQGFWTL